MPFDPEGKLVIAVSASALFDLREADAIYMDKGLAAYRAFQRDHEEEALAAGVAMPFVRRLLSLNAIEPSVQPVEVVLLSRNDPDTGLRVFNSIEAMGLDISRAAFTNGRSPWPYLPAFNACLYLSANAEEVAKAIREGHPAGTVLESHFVDDTEDPELRIAFDFDGVLGSDESERVFKSEGLDAFHDHEIAKGDLALRAGPLKALLERLARLQAFERKKRDEEKGYVPRIRTAIITARSAPAHKRLVSSLREWGIAVDEVFFLGGMKKKRILELFRPHLFFDDQRSHLEPVADALPSVHVPFGVANESPPEAEISSPSPSPSSSDSDSES